MYDIQEDILYYFGLNPKEMPIFLSLSHTCKASVLKHLQKSNGKGDSDVVIFDDLDLSSLRKDSPNLSVNPKETPRPSTPT